MKLSFIIFTTFLIGFFINHSKVNYNYELIPRKCDCDTINGLWIKGYRLGILPLEIKDIKFKKEKQKTFVYGTVVDKQTKVTFPNVDIFLLTGNENTCYLKGPVAKSDSLGKFKYELKSQKEIRLLFSFIGMENIELKIKECR